MYLLDSTTHRLLLDVVTTVVLHRDLRLPTGLEDTVLERCRWDGTARVMDPSDLFWTVLLHCLFDKQDFSPRRCAELTSALSCLVPGGPGERCYTRLSGGVPSAAELVSLSVARTGCPSWPWPTSWSAGATLGPSGRTLPGQPSLPAHGPRGPPRPAPGHGASSSSPTRTWRDGWG